MTRLFLKNAPSEELRALAIAEGHGDPSPGCARQGRSGPHQPQRSRQDGGVAMARREPRAIVLVLDSVGVGALPDAGELRRRGLEHARQHRCGGRRTRHAPSGTHGARQHHRSHGRAARRDTHRVVGQERRGLSRQGHHHRALGDDGAAAHARRSRPIRMASPPRSWRRSRATPAWGGSATTRQAERRSSRNSVTSTSPRASRSSTRAPTVSSRSPRTRTSSRSNGSTRSARSRGRAFLSASTRWDGSSRDRSSAPTRSGALHAHAPQEGLRARTIRADGA